MNEHVIKVFNEKAKKVALLLVSIGVGVHLLWISFDYILAPEVWQEFAFIRILETLLWILLIFLVKKKQIGWKTMFYIVVISLNAMIGYMINVVPREQISAYFAGFSTVISVVAFFIYFSWREFLIIFVLAVGSVVGFHFLFPNHSIITLFGNGGMTYLSMGIFGTFVCELKRRGIINEITANLKLKEAYEELNSLNEELKIINEQLFEQKQQLAKQNEDILDSIKYAHYLQSAVLNDERILKKYFEYFFLYLPRDIVSGDFIWSAESEDFIFIALADSTGHGVPGAMVSIFCNNALNEAFQTVKNPTPAKILTKTRSIIKNVFLTKGREIKDGMDIAMMGIKKDFSKILYAGANSSICIYTKDGNITRIQGNKMPVGLYFIEEDFWDRELPVEMINTIYLYSDGYPDQFGGKKGKKLMFKRFKSLLEKIAPMNLQQQKEELKNFLIKWMGNQKQIDDISILGVKWRFLK